MLLVKKFKSYAGFTLIELMVSVSIVALVSGIFLVNYHSANKQSELSMSAQKLVSDIRLAQSYSLGSKEYGLGKEIEDTFKILNLEWPKCDNKWAISKSETRFFFTNGWALFDRFLPSKKK